ncbi:MAG: glyoxalase [Hirschia sp.]|nr:glyoxalase [Hirschia sp.]MBF17859.1 glyoxalase [Hirschia sp.]|tara:strand:- start:155 stop:526 length:372 start_codon:yes stop_codon:yes gene_type:complete
MPTVTTNGEITIALTVKDRAASSAWFNTHFGFTELYSIDEAGWTEMQTSTPGVTLGLGEATEAQPGNCVPVFGVESVDTARAALETVDTKFDGDTMQIDGMVRLATFYDLDGNAFMLAQDLTK